jgi:hypothetical protein
MIIIDLICVNCYFKVRFMYIKPAILQSYNPKQQISVYVTSYFIFYLATAGNNTDKLILLVIN